MALTRSENMSRIRSSDTKPEIELRRALWKQGIRYRLNYKVEGIRPDLVLTKSKLVVFVDGCQWHGCPEHYVRPRSRSEFWQAKLLTNVERDTKQTNILQEAGWSVLRVWEHEIWQQLSEVVSSVQTFTEAGIKNDWRVFRVEVIDAEADLECRHMRLLNNPEIVKTVERVRSTKKWSRNNE